MDPLIIYTCCLGGILSLLGLKTFLEFTYHQLYPLALIFYLRYCTLSALPRTRWIGHLSWSEMIMTVSYWAGTLICNVIAVKSLADAGSRAASLAILHLVPLLLASRLHFAADLLGIPLRILTIIHRMAGWMVILQCVTHIAIIAQTRGIQWRDDRQQKGIIVSHLSILPSVADVTI